jgi:hypothetical protein
MAKIVLYTGLNATFRTIGQGSVGNTQHLFSIENNATATRVVGIRSLVCQLDATAALASVMPLVKTTRGTTISGGTTVTTLGTFDTSQSSNGVVVRTGSSADGTSVAITATMGSAIMWEQYAMRLHTAVGQVLALDNPLVPTLADGTPVLLRAGQNLLVTVIASGTAYNPTTNHWFVQCVWEEFTE